MPTQSRGFFSCDFCGLQHDTEEEARDHELTQCARRRPYPGTAPPQAAAYQQQTQRGQPYFSAPHQQQPLPPYPSAAMGPLSAAEMEGYPPYHFAAAAVSPYGHHPSMMMGGSYFPSGKDKAILLLNPHDHIPNLTVEDNLSCQHIEVFEATAESIAEYESSRKQAPPESIAAVPSTNNPAPRQIGMRCIHCSKYPQSAPSTTLTAVFRMVFPPSVASMADVVRRMADHHLSSCRMAPVEVQEACQLAVTRRRPKGGESKGNDNRDDDETRAALIDYCVGFCQQVGIANKQQHKSGMEYVQGASTTTGVAARPLPYGGGGSAYLDRMMGGPGYPKQPPPPYGGMAPRLGMGPVGESPAHGFAPTPLQRTRSDRPVEEGLPPSTGGNTPSTMGYPTPFASQRKRGSAASEYSASGEMPTPAQPLFDRRDSTGGGGSTYLTPASGGTRADVSPRGEYQDQHQQQQQFDLPSNFPFYQERDRTWHCKFCSNIHPHHRDPQAIWGSRDGGPPPGNFIDHHLHMCRAYQQGHLMPPPGALMHPGAAGGFGMPPPPYGPGGWEQMQYPGMHPQHDYMFGYPPAQVPSHHEARENIAGGGRFDQGGVEQDTSGGMYPASSARAPRVAEQANMPANTAAMNHAMEYLVNFDKEYYERDAETASIPKLVLDEDRLLLTDYFFFLMKQLRLCRFSEADRKTRGGKREKIKIGYGGLQCIHCADLPMSRKFFWSNVDRLANSFAEIPGHVLKCKRCPAQCKDALLQLKQGHPEQMAKLPRGSQKVFFRRMWARLHDGDPEDKDEQAASPDRSVGSSGLSPSRPTISTNIDKNSPESQKLTDVSPSSGNSEETALVVQRSAKEAAAALAASANEATPPSPSSRVLLAIPEDKEWLSEKDIFVRKQLEVFCATEEDVAAARDDLKYPVSVGQVGIRCIHCALAHGSDAVGHAVAYPFNISGIHESVREIHRLHLDSCKNIPAAKKARLANLGASSLSSVLRRYYVLGAKALGLRDTKSSGIRSGGESSPIGSQAAFSFAETDEGEDADLEEEKFKSKEDQDLKPAAHATSEDKETEASKGIKRSSDAEDEDDPPAKMAKTEKQHWV
ncbi:hypothetical protein IV203_008276 [Nitzschia inconspicua]|uniref:Uncharacterized protein n=1 Tax=Nitzschia inconspicua TaxID=303405 RepID=A0A9K3PM03_9STRA|nr:hypothetical protein IV203_008276 [Nitzschia inconspicua]